jgi:hypothetical protein
VALASAFALLLTALPIPASMGLRALRGLLAGVAPTGAIVAGLLTTMVMVGVGLVGAYLALLTRFGLEETQAFTTLDHPGFKHFLRLRVRADGRGIDGWCIGIVDPLRHGEQPVLVDRFMWRPAACGGALPADRSREHGASDSAETRPLAGSAGS